MTVLVVMWVLKPAMPRCPARGRRQKGRPTAARVAPPGRGLYRTSRPTAKGTLRFQAALVLSRSGVWPLGLERYTSAVFSMPQGQESQMEIYDICMLVVLIAAALLGAWK